MHNLTPYEIRNRLDKYMKFGRSVASQAVYVDGQGYYFVIKTAVPFNNDRFNIGLFRTDDTLDVMWHYGSFSNLGDAKKVLGNIVQ